MIHSDGSNNRSIIASIHNSSCRRHRRHHHHKSNQCLDSKKRTLYAMTNHLNISHDVYNRDLNYTSKHPDLGSIAKI